MIKYIVVIGNPCDGFGFHGPFGDSDAASEWAECNVKDEDSWVAPIESTEPVNGPKGAVILAGGPKNGFAAHGPFPDGNTAESWGKARFKHDQWDVMPLHKPV